MLSQEKHCILHILLILSYEIVLHGTGFMLMKAVHHIYLLISLGLAVDRMNAVVTAGKKNQLFLVTHSSSATPLTNSNTKGNAPECTNFFLSGGDIGLILKCFGLNALELALISLLEH